MNLIDKYVYISYGKLILVVIAIIAILLLVFCETIPVDNRLEHKKDDNNAAVEIATARIIYPASLRVGTMASLVY